MAKTNKVLFAEMEARLKESERLLYGAAKDMLQALSSLKRNDAERPKPDGKTKSLSELRLRDLIPK
ncbi:MAG: hypothetical protein FWF24_07830 [Alphaproteobacteria bacterium]|nr:hypothetical protein [Alphaproteobacteria bacterium]